MKSAFLKKVIALVAVAGLATLCLAACASGPTGTRNPNDNIIRIGATPEPHAEILAQAQDALAEKGYELQIVEYDDYVQPNMDLNNNDLDANYFQHLAYLNDFNEDHKLNLVDAVGIHFEPFGLYSNTLTDLADLENGSTIIIPDDTTNQARALLLLEQESLLRLDESAGLMATTDDILDNPRRLRIKVAPADQIPYMMADADLVAINGNYAVQTDLNVDDALASESDHGAAAVEYVNVVAVKEGNELTAKMKALIEALTSPEMREFIQTQYKGAVVPLF